MKRLKKKRILLAASILLLTVGLVAGYTLTRHSNNTVAPSQGNSTKNEPVDYNDTQTNTAPTPSTKVTATMAPADTPQPLSKPTLQKSSGNAPGSSVPSGAAMEFTCEGTLSSNCEILLTERNNPNKAITLPAKVIASNGRGAYFASWSWTAVSGSWSVQAKTSNTTGSYSISDSQTLEVK